MGNWRSRQKAGGKHDGKLTGSRARNWQGAGRADANQKRKSEKIWTFNNLLTEKFLFYRIKGGKSRPFKTNAYEKTAIHCRI